MKYLFLLFPFFANGQCTVSGITFGQISECNTGTNKWYVPVNLTATGTGGNIAITLIDTDFSYPVQNFEYEDNLTMLVYNEANGLVGDFEILVTLTGGNCSGESLQKQFTYTAPIKCDCTDKVELTGTLAQDRTYTARDTLISNQTISGNTVILGAGAVVILDKGFHYIATPGKMLTVNNEGCE